MNALFTKPKSWHDARRKGIGGSDATVIMGGDPVALVRLWQEKRGEVEPENLDWILPVQIGNATESLNLAFLNHVMSGLEFTTTNEQCVHPVYGFMRCNPDAIGTDMKTIAQFKHVNAWAKMPDVISKYTAQCQHEMFVTGTSACYMSVFIGTMTHEYVRLEADPIYQDLLLDRCKQFWSCVQSGEMPADLPTVATPIPVADRKPYDMTGNNAWASAAQDWLDNAQAAKVFKASEKAIRELVAPDASEAKGHGIIAKVSKDGKIGIKEVK